MKNFCEKSRSCFSCPRHACAYPSTLFCFPHIHQNRLSVRLIPSAVFTCSLFKAVYRDRSVWFLIPNVRNTQNDVLNVTGTNGLVAKHTKTQDCYYCFGSRQFSFDFDRIITGYSPILLVILYTRQTVTFIFKTEFLYLFEYLLNYLSVINRRLYNTRTIPRPRWMHSICTAVTRRPMCHR